MTLSSLQGGLVELPVLHVKIEKNTNGRSFSFRGRVLRRTKVVLCLGHCKGNTSKEEHKLRAIWRNYFTKKKHINPHC